MECGEVKKCMRVKIEIIHKVVRLLKTGFTKDTELATWQAVVWLLHGMYTA